MPLRISGAVVLRSVPGWKPNAEPHVSAAQYKDTRWGEDGAWDFFLLGTGFRFAQCVCQQTSYGKA